VSLAEQEQCDFTVAPMCLPGTLNEPCRHPARRLDAGATQ
jgi:hypothetical protein